MILNGIADLAVGINCEGIGREGEELNSWPTSSGLVSLVVWTHILNVSSSAKDELYTLVLK